jgi:tRNA nucleotidyltransferase (CCA-adding enzyme)
MVSTNEERATQFPHGADIGVRGTGKTRAVAFAQAAAALAASVVDPATVIPSDVISIACEAPNERLLLYDWLNAVIYEMAVRGMVFSRFEVSVHGPTLEGRAWGEALDASRHAPAVEPKGATMTGLKVEQTTDGTWTAECIVDV